MSLAQQPLKLGDPGLVLAPVAIVAERPVVAPSYLLHAIPTMSLICLTHFPLGGVHSKRTLGEMIG